MQLGPELHLFSFFLSLQGLKLEFSRMLTHERNGVAVMMSFWISDRSHGSCGRQKESLQKARWEWVCFGRGTQVDLLNFFCMVD